MGSIFVGSRRLPTLLATVRNRRGSALSLVPLVAHWASASLIPAQRALSYACLKPSALRAQSIKVRESRWLPRTEKQNTRYCGCSVLLDPGGYLLSRAVSSQVPSAYEGLTAVFGMGTGGSLQLNHRKVMVLCKHLENCIDSNSL